jgi:hypothetical protein
MAIVNDVDMTYDLEEHYYILSAIAVQQRLNINLEDELGGLDEANVFLHDIADKLHQYIWAYIRSVNRPFWRWRMYANEVEERTGIKKAMLAMVRYAINDEGDMVGDQTGLNIVAGQKVSLEELRGRIEISANAEETLYNYDLLYGGLNHWSLYAANESGAVEGVDY